MEATVFLLSHFRRSLESSPPPRHLSAMPSPYSDLLFWCAVVVCAVAQVGILRPLVAPREAPVAATRVPAARRGTEVLWGVVPALALALLLAATWRAVHPRQPAAPAPAAPALTLLDDVAGVGSGAR